MGSTTRFNHMAPQFAVEDVSRATGFYAAALGFELDYLDGDPVRYAVVFRDEVYIHLSRAQPPDFVPGGGRAFVAVAGVDEIWDRVRREAPDSIVHPLEDIDYGHGVHFRVFAISDPDGNSLRIGRSRPRLVCHRGRNRAPKPVRSPPLVFAGIRSMRGTC